jgi:hypothetical protein
MKQKNIRLIVSVLGVAALLAIQLPACKSSTKKADNNVVDQAKDSPADLPSSADSAAIYAQLLVSDANELNSQCPIMVDKETRLDNAQPMVKENTLRYNYTFIDREKKYFKDIPKVKDRLAPGIINVVKTNPDLEIYRQHQTTLEYYYKDKNGEFLFSVVVTPDLYGSK